MDSMEQINGLFAYFKSLIDDLYSEWFSISDVTDDSEISFIYKYMIDDSKDFSEFDKDYFNCEQYKDIDRKLALKNLMYSVYCMVKFYHKEEEDLYENVFLDKTCIDNEQIHSNFDELFELEEFGKDIVDCFLYYSNRSEAKRKEMAMYLIKNKNFMNLLGDDYYTVSLLVNDINMEISEEAMLVNTISNIYDLIDMDKVLEVKSYTSMEDAYEKFYSDVTNLDKVKKTLILNSLVKDLNTQSDTQSIKHLFSIMVKSVYLNLYIENSNSDFLKMPKRDKSFYDLINENKITFDELFYKFINDSEFSSYLIGNFYFNNVDKNSLDYEDDNLIYQNEELDEKIKKYYV